MALLQMHPGPLQAALQRRIGQRRQVIGHLFDGDMPLDVSHQRAEDFGMVGTAQRVEQRFFVGLTRTFPGLVACIEVADVFSRVEAAVQ